MSDCASQTSQQFTEMNALNSKLSYDAAAQLQHQAQVDNQQLVLNLVAVWNASLLLATIKLNESQILVADALATAIAMFNQGIAALQTILVSAAGTATKTA